MGLQRDWRIPKGKADEMHGGASRFFNGAIRPLCSSFGLRLRQPLQNTNMFKSPEVHPTKSVDVHVFADRQMTSGFGLWSLKISIAPLSHTYLMSDANAGFSVHEQKMLDADMQTSPLTPSETYVVAENMAALDLELLKTDIAISANEWLPLPKLVRKVPKALLRPNEVSRLMHAIDIIDTKFNAPHLERLDEVLALAK